MQADTVDEKEFIIAVVLHRLLSVVTSGDWLIDNQHN